MTTDLKLEDLLQVAMHIKNLPKPPYSNGADMHPETANQLRVMCEVRPPDLLGYPFGAIEVHERTYIPLGEVRECTCSRKKDA